MDSPEERLIEAAAKWMFERDTHDGMAPRECTWEEYDEFCKGWYRDKVTLAIQAITAISEREREYEQALRHVGDFC